MYDDLFKEEVKEERLAIVYYWDVMRLGNQAVNITICDSGEEAMKVLKGNAKGSFQMPAIHKGKQELPSKGQYNIGFSFRGWTARYLNKTEIKLVKKYGKDGVWINHEKKRLVKPEED